MIKDITIGQFFPGNSVIHKLDPRIKLVLTFVYIVIVFLCKNFVSLASIVVALTVVILLSKISPKLIWKSVKPIFIIIAITSLLQIFYNKDGTVLFTIGKFSLYTGGLYMAIFTTVRIICLVIASSMLTYTTSPTMLTDAMERLFSPLKVIKINVHSIAMMMTIALRFIPLFINSFRRAYELAFAMECRCYRGGEGRTRLKVMRLEGRDYVAVAVIILLTAGIIVANIFLPAVI